MSARMAGDATAWDGARREELRALWTDGHTVNEIGRRMGITRNAVVGKAHRMNLPPRPSPIRPGVAPGPRKITPKPERKLNVARSSVVLPVEVARVAPPPAPIQRVQPATACGHCRFIVGWDAERPRYSVACDAPTSGGSWCAEHRRVVFTTRPVWYESQRQAAHA